CPLGTDRGNRNPEKDRPLVVSLSPHALTAPAARGRQPGAWVVAQKTCAPRRSDEGDQVSYGVASCSRHLPDDDHATVGTCGAPDQNSVKAPGRRTGDYHRIAPRTRREGIFMNRGQCVVVRAQNPQRPRWSNLLFITPRGG